MATPRAPASKRDPDLGLASARPHRRHPRRRRRLDLRAVARDLLSRRPRAAARTRIREPPPQRHRDQRHLLLRAEARHLRALARRNAGRLRVHREGADADRAVEGAGEDGGPGRRLRRRASRRSATSSARSSGNSNASSIATTSRAFVEHLPASAGGRPVRHALEVRDAECVDTSLVDLARKKNAALVFTDSDEWPSFADVTADFVYARLMRARGNIETGYTRGRTAGMGGTRAHVGEGRRTRRPAASRRRRRRRRSSATCSCSSSTRTRNATPPRRRR